MRLFKIITVQFVCLIFSSSLWALSCDSLFELKKGVSTNPLDAVLNKFKQRDDELSFLKKRVGKDIPILVFESDVMFSETLRELKLEAVRKNSDGVVFFTVSEMVNGEWVRRETPFSRLTVLGEKRDLNIEFQKISKKKIDEVLERRFADTWKRNFSIFYTAHTEKAWVVVSDLSQKNVIIAQVEAIDIDSMEVISVRLTNVNGTNVARTIQLTDFHNVEILGRVSAKKEKWLDISHVFPDEKNKIGAWDSTELLSMEFMNPERVRSLTHIKSAIEKNLFVQWNENGKSVVGSVKSLFKDESNMAIVEIKDPNSDRSIFRTITSLDGIKVLETYPSGKPSNSIFEKADSIFYQVSERAFRERNIEERQILEYWKSALVSGANVRWYQTIGSTIIDGRIEQIFSDVTNEILIVVRTQSGTVVKTLEGFTIVPTVIKVFGSVDESVLQMRHYPTITHDRALGSEFDSRARVSKQKERDLIKHGLAETIATLKFALLQNRKVDLQFQIEIPGEYRSELAKEKRRAQILSIEDEVVVVKFVGDKAARIVTTLSIRNATLVE